MRVKGFSACFVVVFLCIFVFAGCGSTPKPTESATTASTQPASESPAKEGVSVFDGEITVKGGPYKVALSNFSVGNSWRVQMVAEFENACEELKKAGVLSEYFVTNADGDISKQISDVRDMMTKKVDMIVITCASGTALTDVCDEAMKEGIKVVSFDNYLEYDDGQVHETSRIGVDQVEFGKIGGKWLAEALGGKGNIIVLNGMEGTLGSEQRWSGAESELKKFSDIKVLGIGYGDWDYAKGKAAAEQLIAAYGDKINGVYSQGGAMTQGAIDAFNERGMKPVPMTGEANNGMLKAWKANKDKGFTSVAPDAPSYVSAEALKLALRACEGEDVSGFHPFEFQIVTDENLDKYVNAELPDSFWVFTRLTNDRIKELFSK